MTGRLLRVKEVSERTGVPKSTLYSWHRARTGPPAFYFHGRVLVYRETLLDAWIAQQEAASGDAA